MNMAQLTPPIFAFGLARVDSAAKNITLPYSVDEKFFSNNPKRRTYVRNTWSEEFDKHIVQEFKAELPRLHVMVVQLSTGIHYVAPVFRTNSPFWSEPRTDADVANVIAEMGRLGGFDLDEMMAFAAKHCDDFKQSDVLKPLNGQIH